MPYKDPADYAKWVSRNRARSNAIKRAWSLRNKERDKELKRAWSRNNKAYEMEKCRRYQASKLMAIPAWANRDAMEQKYEDARRLTNSTGVRHEVDHIVPLRSPLVCGLHCEANLQVIPMFDNRSKANDRWPDMP